MESQDGESANEVPVVRNYKHKETRNVRFTNLFPNLRSKHIPGFSAIRKDVVLGGPKRVQIIVQLGPGSLTMIQYK